ncbi:YcdB/YcdC domain-containing protein [Paenibacillus sinopodophylli]|uniref:YcdB/YcdC domain-containing protein n=1 Tax=Paenibacillus sinopodophylli TaxID=1837342 RepID=UPI00110CAC27|nr:YcdB/YcdC domain-containing protein [Paenibacillus sinopodophylli]
MIRQGQRVTSSKWVKGIIGITISLGLLNGTMFSQSSFAAGESAYAQQVETAQDEKLISEEEALERTAKLFPGLLKAGENEVAIILDESEDYRSTWAISWKEKADSSPYVISVQVDALNGQIIDYYHSLHASAKPIYPLQTTLDQANKKAKRFVAKVIPEIKETDLILDTEYTEYSRASLFHPAYYALEYHLLINGYSSFDESVSVIINGNGDVVSFSASLTNRAYPKPDLKVTKQQAEDKFKEDMQLQLFYIPMDEESGYFSTLSDEYRMVYGDAREMTPFIDARTGEKLLGWNDDNTEESVQYNELNSLVSPFKQPTSGTLSEDQALAALMSKISLPPNATKGSAIYLEDWYGISQSVWEFNWKAQKEAGIQLMTATVEAETGQLLVFNSMIMEDEDAPEPTVKKPSISQQAAKQKSVDLVTGVFQDAAKYLRVENEINEYETYGQTVYNTYFNQVYNGAPISNSYVRVSIDGDGYLWDYRRSFADPEQLEKKVSSLKQTITEEKAHSLMQNALSAELIYIHQTTTDAAGESGTAVKLVYEALINQSRDYYIINAVTGELELVYDESEQAAPESINKPTDIAKHWARNQLGMMVEYGILDTDEEGRLYPDSSITIGNWIDMVSRVETDSYNSYYGAGMIGTQRELEQAEQYGYEDEYSSYSFEEEWLEIYKDEEPEFFEQTLTRDQLAFMLMQMLDYDKLSVFMSKDKDVTSLKDYSSIQNKGAAALAIKLGLLTTTSGKFHPNAPVTKAQASVLMVRLANLQGKLDTPLFS